MDMNIYIKVLIVAIVIGVVLGVIYMVFFKKSLPEVFEVLDVSLLLPDIPPNATGLLTNMVTLLPTKISEPVQLPPTPTYIGCYKDGRSDRSFPKYLSGMKTLQSCNDAAKKYNSEYFGIQYCGKNTYGECWIGNSSTTLNSGVRHGSATNCSTQTWGKCGEKLSNAVYKTV
jgi:hypothetical protein